jgi:hypothetical protein
LVRVIDDPDQLDRIIGRFHSLANRRRPCPWANVR